MKENTISKLKESPLFNLSLSSKELFHSNFLFWVGNNYPSEFGKLFKSYLKEQPSDFSVKVKREKGNIDLTLIYPNNNSINQELLIENKVKSIPYVGQLEKYSDSNTSSKNYLLLSLTKPMFFMDENKLEIKGVIWYYLSYADLKNMLIEMSEAIGNEYHRQIVRDYCVFIEGMTELENSCSISEDDTFDFHSINNNTLYKDLHEIRLHDLYLKKKYELLAYKIYQQLKRQRSNLIGFSQPMYWESTNPMIFIGYGMTRATGLTDLKYLIEDNIALGIQIQGESYRMVIEDNNGKIAGKIKDELLIKKLWFDFGQSFPDKTVYPTNENKSFNKYGNVFFYKSVNLGTNLKIKDVIELVLRDVNKIDSNFKEISGIIKKAKGID